MDNTAGVRRTKIFVINSYVSSILFACWALILVYVNNAMNTNVIPNVIIIIAHAVSLLVNAIFVFLYFKTQRVNLSGSVDTIAHH
jgi:hypothetical protein